MKFGLIEPQATNDAVVDFHLFTLPPLLKGAQISF